MVPTKWTFHSSTVNALAWTHDGRALLSGASDNCIMAWQASQPSKPLATFRNAHGGPVGRIVMLPAAGGGYAFATCASDACVRFWRLAMRP